MSRRRAVMGTRVSAGAIAGTAVATVSLIAVPFLVKAVSDEHHLAVATVGLLSTMQLGGLAVASWAAPRLIRPRRRVIAWGSLLGLTACLVAAFAGSFAVLLAAVFADGMSLGLIAWIAWAEVFGDDDKVGDVAVIAPVVGTVAAPTIAVVLSLSGARLLFVLVALLNLVPIAFAIRGASPSIPTRTTRGRHRPQRSALALLACLFGTALGGSCLAAYAAVIGRDTNGMSTLAVSLAYSVNAAAGIPSARWRRPRRWAGAWVALTGLGVLGIGVVAEPWMFWIGMAVWGFGYWMGVPGAFALLASRSAYPGERAGDAQAVMSAARVIGPVIGGAVFTHSAVLLGVVAAGFMFSAAAVMGYVEWRVQRSAVPLLGAA